MKKRNELITALICLILLFILVFIIGLRVSLHHAEQSFEQRKVEAVNAAVEAAITPYRERVTVLEKELADERAIEHVEIEYVPLPVDYPIAEEVPYTAICMLAQMGIGEDRGIDVRPEAIAAAYQTVFNRVDSENPYFPDTISGVLTQPNAYQGYSPSNPVDARYYSLALDCWFRWQLKKLGVSDPGYVIPYNCVSFHGSGGANHFMLPDGSEWKWTLPNPYAAQEAELK